MQALLRSTAWLMFFIAILGAWWMMFVMSIQMDLDFLGRPGEAGVRMAGMDPRMPMDMPMARFGPLFGMWGLMMAAMMLPTLVPTLRAYDDLIISANGTRIGWFGVIWGYGIAWLIFAAGIAAIQLGLLFAGLVDMLGIAKSSHFTAALLIIVGLFQFSRTKEICHGVCFAPAMYFLGHWRTGFIGGARMGFGLGCYCVLCCWGFMALGFVGGVMNLTWMGLATLFMVIEKLPQVGRLVTRPMGAVLCLAGGLVLMGGLEWQ